MEDREWLEVDRAAGVSGAAGEEGAELVARDYKVEVSGKRFEVKVIGEARRGRVAAAGGSGHPNESASPAAAPRASSESLPSPCRARSSKSRSRRGPRSPRVS